MQVLYFGTVCELEEYEDFLKCSSAHPSVASVVFETAILEGLKENEIEVSIFSFPMIPNFWTSKILGWGAKKQMLDCGYNVTWLPTINILGLKQISRYISARYIIRKWLKEHRDEEGTVLLYSICPFIAPSVVKLCGKYNKKSVVIVPDLPSNMFMNHKMVGVKKYLSKKYLDLTKNTQKKFDGYIYLTRFMREVINSTAPSIVIEGVVNKPALSMEKNEKSFPRAIMYAGRLHEKYGIKNLIEAYLSIPHQDNELWLFGAGSFENEILEYSKQDSSIKFWGNIDRNKILAYEQQATLLVNCRSHEDEYAKYSFPSKTMEYMASGTPVYTTKLPGIPKEYVKYLFTSDSNSVDEIQKVLEMVFDMSEIELNMIGKNAKKFVVEEKNAKKQAEKIIYLLNSVIKE